MVGVLALAVPVLILSLGWSGWDGWRRARGVDWNPHKPVWWLVREANGRDAAARDAALTELTKRIGAGRLTHGQEEALVNRVLEIQADLSKTWLPAWGTLVEAAHDTGGLSPAKWQRYVVQVPTMVLESEPASVRRCDEFFLLIRKGADRTGGANARAGRRWRRCMLRFTPIAKCSLTAGPLTLANSSPRDVFLQASKWINTEPAPREIEPNQIPLQGTGVMPGPPRPRVEGPAPCHGRSRIRCPIGSATDPGRSGSSCTWSRSAPIVADRGGQPTCVRVPIGRSSWRRRLP